jgi:hypothetical protein
MRIPRRITVNGQTWRVVFKPLASRGLDGLCLHRRREIQIDWHLTRPEQEETFLHELMHACLATGFTMKAEERFIRRLSPRLYEALEALS